MFKKNKKSTPPSSKDGGVDYGEQNNSMSQSTPMVDIETALPVPNPLSIPLGRFEDGSELAWDVPWEPHMVVIGHRGSGKSVMQRNVLLHCAQYPEVFEVAGIDLKKTEILPYLGKSPVLKTVVTDALSAQGLMVSMHKELETRYKRMNDEYVNNFRDLANPPKRLIILADEIGFLLDTELATAAKDPQKPDDIMNFSMLFKQISLLGRAAGMHLVISSQAMEDPFFKKMKDPMAVAFVGMGYIDPNIAKDILGDENACEPNGSIQGRGYFSHGRKSGKFQSYYADVSSLPK